MGTSNSYGGARGSTPLVASWVDLPDTGFSNLLIPNSPIVSASTNSTEEQSDDPKPTVPDKRPSLKIGDSERFSNARGSFTSFIKSGGRNRSKLGKAISDYIRKSNGGSKNSSKRMGSSRRATAGLLSFFSAVQNQGAAAALKSFDLGNLVGKSIEDIFLGLAEFICPDGGSIDEGIARSAFIETIAELSVNGITDIDKLTPAQMQTVLEIFSTHSIEQRLCNDIGTKICIAAEKIQDFERAQNQLHEFINRSVSDAFTKANINIKSITPQRSQQIVDIVYESAFQILQQYSDREADKE